MIGLSDTELNFVRKRSVELDRVDDCVLALLQLTLHDGARAWKGFDSRSWTGSSRRGIFMTREAGQSRLC